MTSLLEVRNLKKYFKTPHGVLHAVDDVSFSIEKGDTLGVVGESGCGKSTLGRCILKLHDTTAGTVTYDGTDITDLSPGKFKKYRRRMQMIFQDPFSSLNPRMSVSQIIAEPLIIHDGCSGATLGRRVGELMDTVGLARRLAPLYPHELDGGRRQRIGIARALSLNPEFIVCDEPVSALDVSIQAQVLNLIQDLQEQRKLTYMFISHNMSVVKHLSRDVMVMYMGTVVEYSSGAKLFRGSLHPYTQALLEAIPLPELSEQKRARQLLRGEVSSPIDPRPCCRFLKRCVHATDECRNAMPSLKEWRPGHFVACHNVDTVNGPGA